MNLSVNFQMEESEAIEELQERFFNFLLKKICTEKQAQDFLNKAKVTENQFDYLMREAKDTGLIDDESYAKLFAEGHEAWGNAKISFELSKRGIESENINSALENITEESQRAKELYNSWKNILDNKKISSRLLSRGFSYKSINKILKNKDDIDF